MSREPKYVLRTVENIRVYKNAKAAAIKKAVGMICGVMLIGSLAFGKNLFGELSLIVEVLLLGLVIGAFVKNQKEFSPFPLELYFYEDRIEIHKPHVPYDNGKIKRELYVFKYADHPTFTYGQRTKYMTIRGIARGEWYLHTKDGTVSPTPERIRENIKGICYFFVGDPKIDIVGEIEQHAPIKVTVENN